MEKDQPLVPRRSVLRVAAALSGAAVLGGLLATERSGMPERAAPGGRPGAAPPARGPEAAARPQQASAYRLQPMTAQAPLARRALPPVRTRPLLELPGEGRTMVLTFDDGPDPRYTPAVLETLRAHGVPAMFFVCGEMARYHPDLLREMADGGHLIGNHTWSHPLVPGLAPSAIRRELGRTSDIVEKTVGAAPRWYRAPYGAWNKHSFEIGAELGMEPLAWTVDTLDWTEPGTGTIVRRVMDGAAPGVVVLSHDAGGDRSQSVAALRRYLPRLVDAGYRITVPRV
ncbi:polysaccharide deacetylase family protein [Streptomyces genisteinicus]|uniref:Polysaccharide deacetylase family protein n=1 Tax=Streptomyces genisteinicus TaxID=2768068 RepID=A0A7H0I1P6_9ACTN|nr:polysaccharide deacetylase family protein [Streptomyces genisteinicus]QNP66712.1 polysaccharide deacetylase family protein [Streptomyces genisteinicus]